jgi:hypothetical protein
MHKRQFMPLCSKMRCAEIIESAALLPQPVMPKYIDPAAPNRLKYIV